MKVLRFSKNFTFEAKAQEIAATEFVGVSKKVGKFHVDMFTSLENQIPSTPSITILVFVEYSLCKMGFRENQFYKANSRLWFTKTKIVVDRVDGI